MPLKCCCLPLSFQLVVLALQLTCCCYGIVSEHGTPAQNPTYRLPRDFNYYTNWTKYMQSKAKYQWKEELFRWVFVRLVSHCTAVRTMPLCCSLALPDRCTVYQAGMMTVTVFIFFHSSVLQFKACPLFCDYIVLLGVLQVKLQKICLSSMIQTNRRETMISLMLNCICLLHCTCWYSACVCLKALVCVWVSKALPVAWHPSMV